jgi:hypothetical protein
MCPIGGVVFWIVVREKKRDDSIPYSLDVCAYVENDGNWGRGNERIRDELVVCMLYDRG